MITEIIFNFFANALLNLLCMLPTVDFDVLSSWNEMKEFLLELLRGISLLIPFDELQPLMIFQVSLWGFKIVYAIILRIKSFIPSIGGT